MTYSFGTIREAYAKASSFLAEAGVRDPGANAELLLQHVLGADRTAFLLALGDPFPEDKREAWLLALQRKAAGEPVQYIIGEQEFYGLAFTVTPAVLIPRPETELLVEAVIRYGRQLFPQRAPSAVDIGTGSGAIPVTLAVECPDWTICSSDISEAALKVAAANAGRHGVAERVELLQGDLLEPHLKRGTAIDILVSNPPYIPSREVEELQPEVKSHEPRSALDGGEDGLDLYRRMAAQMQRLPRYPRLVGFEVGQGQAREVGSLLEQQRAWDRVFYVKDLAGIERHVLALREHD
ncbi:peptide chain release factor N(5)-glutamine methyltransferase [Paenibacillus aurantius]|uniref:Release factor glutamine methyltransferase n=1 Tax=Paenibacillus aurantius TaxID=2918900 RepID=A0AA96LDW0_9BACL|nr:peptide chain release factor N(5)-glutamine methyltransferase [Paenibacillus aurantius]WNQ11535.1 peptide chain release factor N(5)-glutamine methyltransferase [Paenibacillus aurantius]